MGTHFLRGAVRLGSRIARANIECRLSVFLVQQYFFSFIKKINLQDRDDLSTRNKSVAPKVSLARRFHCTLHESDMPSYIIYDG